MTAIKVENIKSRDVNLNYKIHLPLEILDYLCNDYTYKNTKRLTKLQAFNDLVQRHCAAINTGSQMIVNIAQLSKAWNWSRVTVGAFISDLSIMDIVIISNTPTSKLIALNDAIISNMTGNVQQ